MRFWSIRGKAPYLPSWELQKQLLEARIQGKAPDTVLILEHDPVITRGSGLQRERDSDSETRRVPILSELPEGIAYYDIERGGDLTYHGPGQLVVYPIVRLEDRDLGAFLRQLESVLVSTLGALEIKGEAREGATGVWVEDRKVASIGIAVRKWVTYHGLALNLTNDLKPFFLINPCGFHPEVMTRMKDLLPDADWNSAEWRETVEDLLLKEMVSQFGWGQVDFQELSLEEALAQTSEQPEQRVSRLDLSDLNQTS